MLNGEVNGENGWMVFKKSNFSFLTALNWSNCILMVSLYIWLLIKYMGRVKRIWYLSPMRTVKVQASLRIRAVSPEPPLLAHTSRESRRTFRQKPRSLAPLNGWACAVKICHDGMLEDTKSLDTANILPVTKKPSASFENSILAHRMF